ncbi:MAG: xanthine dehydrogenase family protein subunit M [Alphaproteobacteria bacterium]|nr:xanthine dehydrogenase family protein subunit M [Alphaproteobacteria bacterium]
MTLYLQPKSVDEAVQALSENNLFVLAGGTDYYPARVGKPLDDNILDITGITGLRGISERDDHFHIGALTRWTDIIETALPNYFNGLKLAAREVGGVQIQNAGTIAGNICNASPAADGIPPLLSLNTDIVLASTRGEHSMPLAKFIMGNRKTRCASDEIVTGFRIPKPDHPATSTFLKLGARKYLVISIVMVAAVVEIDNGNVGAIRIAVGSCSATAKRLHMLERALVGQPIAAGIGDLVSESHLNQLAPIDDVRGSAEYRRDAALTLVRRAVEELVADK